MLPSHLSDADLLLLLDGEAPAGNAEVHLAGCAHCRERREQLAETLTDFSSAYRQAHDIRIPALAGPRARLMTRLHERPNFSRPLLAAATLAAVFAGITLWRSTRDSHGEFAPRAALTPGAARPLNRDQVCSAPAGVRPAVPSAAAENIFREYGIRDPRPRSYEVDYLIPPDLGGTDDARNLWPQPYASGVWNARVKDALEDRLRMLVCEGQIDVSTAQHELARDWIGAYRKYFRTEEPLVSHAAFIKDRPWE